MAWWHGYPEVKSSLRPRLAAVENKVGDAILSSMYDSVDDHYSYSFLSDGGDTPELVSFIGWRAETGCVETATQGQHTFISSRYATITLGSRSRRHREHIIKSNVT